MKKTKNKFSVYINNCVIFVLRKIIVFLINKLDNCKVRRGQFSYCHLPNKHITIEKINKEAYVLFWDGWDIGWCINKDFKMCDTALFDPYIEACLINRWFYTALINLGEKEEMEKNNIPKNKEWLKRYIDTQKTKK